jgi:adenosylhomocysteine nucleosidase
VSDRGELRRVALLAPMRQELRPLVRPLGLARPPGGDLLVGSADGVEVVATTTGMGTRAAARAAERVLDAGPVDHLVVVGIAGGIGPSVAIGDLVVPERVIDLASGSEHRPAPLGSVAPRGALATSDELLVDPEAAARLARRGVVAIDMETAAVAAVCERRGCPWSVFRAISDRADDGTTDAAVLGLAGPDGSPNLGALLRFLARRPWRVAQLVRLAGGMHRATRAAAAAAVAALRAGGGGGRGGAVR